MPHILRRLGLSTRENLPDGLRDGSGIDEHNLTERACIRWVYDRW